MEIEEKGLALFDGFGGAGNLAEVADKRGADAAFEGYIGEILGEEIVEIESITGGGGDPEGFLQGGGWGKTDAWKEGFRGAVFGDERLDVIFAGELEVLIVGVGEAEGVFEGEDGGGIWLSGGGIRVRFRIGAVEDFAIGLHFRFLIHTGCEEDRGADAEDGKQMAFHRTFTRGSTDIPGA